MKKTLLWALIASMTFTLCSCGKQDDGATSDSGSDKLGASNSDNDNAEDKASGGKKYIIGKRTTTYKEGEKCEAGEDSYAWDGKKLIMTKYYREGTSSDTTEYIFNDDNLLSEETEYENDGSFNKLYRYEYDSNNNIIKKTEYNANDIATEWLAYTYDSAGNMTKKEKFDAFGEGEVIETNEYDSNGMKIRCSPYISNRCSDYQTFEYNEKGAILSETIYTHKTINGGVFNLTNIKEGPYDDNDYKFYLKKIYEYDSEGRPLGWKTVDESGNLSSRNDPVREVIEYDSQGNIKSDRYYDINNEVIDDKDIFFSSYHSNVAYSGEYEYDDHGNMIGAYPIDDEGNRIGTYIKKAYTYNSDGRPIKCFLGGFAEEGHWEEWEYDKNGNETKYTYYNSKGEIREQTITKWIPVPEYVYNFVNGEKTDD